jgi:hypothetical protein
MRSGAQAAPEEGDDRWGPPVSQARRGAKAARGEMFSRVGGGNPAGHHRRAVGWDERARWAGREAEAQWGGGGEKNSRLKRKKMGRGWAERLDGPKVKEKIIFRIKFDF